MSNTITSELIPRIFAGGIDVLTEQFALVSRIRQDFSPDEKTKGDSVTFNKSTAQVVSDITPSNTAPSAVDSTFGYTKVLLNYWRGTRFNLNAQEQTRILTDNWLPFQMKEAMRALAYDMNAKAFTTFDQNAYGTAGTAGTNPFASNTNPMVDAKDALDVQLCDPAGRFAILGNKEYNAALKLAQVANYINTGDQNGFRKGLFGNAFDIDTKLDVQRTSHVAGTGASWVLNGAQTAGTSSLAVHSGSGTMVVGDILTLQGEVAPYTYVVTTALASGVVVISPPLRQDHSDGDTVTVTGASTTYSKSFVGDEGAMGLAIRAVPNTLEGASMIGESLTMTDPRTRIPMTISFLPGYHLMQIEVSILYGTGILDPRRCVALLGS